MPLKGVCVNALTSTALIYFYIIPSVGNICNKGRCEDPFIPESDFEGARAVVLGVGGQGVFQEAQRQVVLHHPVQHQADVALWRSEGRGKAVSGSGRQAIRLQPPHLLNSSVSGWIHTRAVRLNSSLLVQTVWFVWGSVTEWANLWIKEIKLWSA